MYPDAPIEIILSGGGSKDITMGRRLDELIQEHPEMQNVTLCTEDHNGESLVSIWEIYLLVDPDIGEGGIITEKSYRIVYTAEYDDKNPNHQLRKNERQIMTPHATEQGYRGRFELLDTVDWLAPMGSRVRKTSKKITVDRQFELDVGKEPEPQIMIDVCFDVVSADVANLASRDGLSVKEEGIVYHTELSFEIKTKDLVKFTRNRPEATLGFVQYVDKDTLETIPGRRLEFDCQVLCRWAGMLQIFEVRIPRGGVFP